MEHPTSFNKIVVDFTKEVTEKGKKYPETKYYATSSVIDVVLFDLDGTKPTSGTITINGNGTITYSGIKINGYECTIPETGEITCTEGNGNGNVATANKTYEDGYIVYYNPIANTKCDNYLDANSNNDYKGNENTSIQNGCLRWFAYGDKDGASSVKLLLDHNSTTLVEWSESYYGGNVLLEDSTEIQRKLGKLTTLEW